jgi:glutathione S-transferase
VRIYGTTTSPYVRRVRAVAAELGLPYERIDTATDTGQSALRAVTPIRKVPVAVLDGRTVFDSRAIVDYLTLTRGYGGLAPPRDPWRERNLLNAIDAAIDSAMQVFYLRRDGVAIAGSAFEHRQRDRVDSIWEWLTAQLAADGRTFDAALGLPELSAVCALEWMDFRQAYPTERAPGLARLRAAWAERPSLASTRPVA